MTVPDIPTLSPELLAGLVLLLWVAVIHPSIISLASAPFVAGGYWRLGHRDRRGFLLLLVSQAGLVVLGVAHQEWALPFLIVPFTSLAAVKAYRRAGRPDPLMVGLRADLAAAECREREAQVLLEEARTRIAELEAQPVA